MSCCGSTPEVLNEDLVLRSMVDVLRTRRKALRGGDGFSHAGTLIGAYKRTISRMEELISLVETLPVDEEVTPSENCPACGEPSCPYDWRTVFAALQEKVVLSSG